MTKDDEQKAEVERKRRLAEVFGDVLPDTTADERDDKDGSRGSDEWLKSQVPPHHGD
jgi:hypothetical protein